MDVAHARDGEGGGVGEGDARRLQSLHHGVEVVHLDGDVADSVAALSPLRCAITNAYGTRRGRALKGRFCLRTDPQPLGLSRYTRQLGPGCRNIRDSEPETVAYIATRATLLSQNLRQSAPKVADSATGADERTQGFDDRTRRIDERTRGFDERTQTFANEPGRRQALVPVDFSAPHTVFSGWPPGEKPKNAERTGAGLVRHAEIGYKS